LLKGSRVHHPLNALAGTGRSPAPDADVTGQRDLVHALLAAARDGEIGTLVAVLDPDVVLRADHGAVPAGT
jgi:hypothetical protein